MASYEFGSDQTKYLSDLSFGKSIGSPPAHGKFYTYGQDNFNPRQLTEDARMKIAIPDLISNSYFPAAAAVELGMFKDEGLDMELELIFPVNRTLEVLRDGEIEFVGGSAHSVPHAFPEWSGGKLLASFSRHVLVSYFKAELGAKQGDIEAVKGLNIGAARWLTWV